MTISVLANGRPVRLAGDATVGDLLDHLGLRGLVAVIERNGEALSRAEHERTPLADGDRIELARIVAGG